MHNEKIAADVVVLGGGLAGASIAIQLLRARPELKVVVADRLVTPLPEAAFKVGESTVEIGAHYFRDVLGVEAHLEAEQLPKFGLRYFFEGETADIDNRVELGGREYLPTRSYQLDRGRFENCLREKVAELGGTFYSGATVRDVELNPKGLHSVRITTPDGDKSFESSWVVDATGRNGFLKRRLGLQKEVGHKCNASWWRVRGKIDLSTWSSKDEWKSWENGTKSRWFSTNHLMGAGYWVWLIPLASGFTSIGIVADDALHPGKTVSTIERSMEWLQKYEPQCAEQLKDSEVIDFHFLKHFAHGCKQVFSSERWALTGEAGVFLDPFYSPGSDFICISNTYITDLILRECSGEPIELHALLYDQTYIALFESFLLTYENQYPLFGHPIVMPLKIVWDYALYWSFVSSLVFEKKLTDITLMGSVREMLNEVRALNEQMQELFREWAKLVPPIPGCRALTFGHSEFLVEINRQLSDPPTEAFEKRFKEKLQLVRGLALEISEFVKLRGVPAELGAKADCDKPTTIIQNFLSDFEAPDSKKSDFEVSDAAYA